ncbi:MAG: hypothetical protein A2351_06195 [Omnitrophica bacterium RIFOXYB12_FULL_50_7]|nr:MAG: hypothetical protein A2351_06195 [Omnitrophica bacterium RIFOXYB12_FULL_50_7]
MNKKRLLIIIALLILGWCVFQVAVTPWGELPGKLIYQTNRINVKDGKANIIRESGKQEKIVGSEGFYCYKWAPDGEKIAAFSDKKGDVVLLDPKCEILQRIEMPDGAMGMDISWRPKSDQVFVIEHFSNALDAASSFDHLTIYDFSTNQRIPFYANNDFTIYDIAVARNGDIFFTGGPAAPEHLGKGFFLYRMDPQTKKMTLLSQGPRQIELIDNGKKIVFVGSLRIFGQLITTCVLGVYDIKTGFTRYISFFAGDIRQMTVVEDGKYLVTAEGEGNAVVLYKRSLLGGFKRPITKPEMLAYLDFPSQDQYPDWTA